MKKLPDTCTWQLDADPDSPIWETACSQAFQFNEGDPTGNWFRFCPYCGKPIEVKGPSNE